MSEYAFYDGTNPPTRVPVLPGSARDLETNDWVMGLDQERPGIAQARKRAGYYAIRNTRKPAVDKFKEKAVRKLEMLGDEPCFTYTVEKMTTDELITELAQDEVKNARRAIKKLRTFRKNENPSLVDIRENLDLVNRLLIKMVQDKYGED